MSIKYINVFKKIISILSMLGGLYFGGMGILYIGGYIGAAIAVIRGGANNIGGGGLGFMIGVPILIVSAVLINASIMLFNSSRIKKDKK